MSELTPQELYLLLIEQGGFNGCDGEKIAKDLHANKDLWQAAMLTREGDCGITLRDLARGYNNVDTLYILTDSAHAAAMKALAKTWKPDEAQVLGIDTMQAFLGSGGGGAEKRRVIRLWWD